MPGALREPSPPDGTIGLVPAAGTARRLGPLPCSKELLPIAVDRPERDQPGDRPGDRLGEPPHEARRVRVVADPLLRAFGRAGIERALLVIDRDKMDIPRHFADRNARRWRPRFAAEDAPTGTETAGQPGEKGEAAPAGPALAFVPVADSPSVPHSLAAALPFLGASPVALGFPDVLFTPEDAFSRIEAHRRRSGAAVVLGLFPAPDPTSTDMVEVDDRGRVLRIEVRPRRSTLRLNWLIAVWDRRFTAWLAGRMAADEPGPPAGRGELQLGALLAEALADGLPIEGVPFPDGAYLDIGTPAGYARALATGGLPLSEPPG